MCIRQATDSVMAMPSNDIVGTLPAGFNLAASGGPNTPFSRVARIRLYSAPASSRAAWTASEAAPGK
jgi:hypothetical protein